MSSDTRRSEPGRGPDAPRQLGLLLALARLALVWERLWPALWPALGLAGLFLALALLDALPTLPGWLHGVLLAGFLAAGAVAVARGLAGLRAPTRDQARRRLERDSGLAHRPLAALDDRQAAGTGDPEAVRLWGLHRQRLLAGLRHVRLGLPHPGLAARDPLALRAALGLLLVVAAVAAGDDWRDRLARAVSPNLAALAGTAPAHLDVWINPPVYTGLAPLFLDPKGPRDDALAVPVGSTVLSQVQGGRGVPTLALGGERLAFDAVAEDTYRVSTRIEAGDRLAVEQNGRTLADWRLALLPDEPPGVEFLAPPGRTERAALRLEYQAADDYGLASVKGIIRRLDDPGIEPLELELPLPGTGLETAEATSFHDLTPHPWAGLAVTIQLAARDALGQEGTSEAARTVLPERIFNHPVARALVALRKKLTLDPDARLPVVRSLGEIYERPDHYFHDLTVALALRSAERRLIHDPTRGAVAQVQKLLWDTALHLEEGELAIAERDLRDIQKKLMDALARDADDAEIERLMDELKAALDRFLEALAEQLREQMARGEEPEPLPPDAQMLQGDDLQQLIDRAREMARTGSREAARELLAQLQRLLENLRANPFAQGMDQQSRNAFRMMEDMESLMQRQQELLDRNFRRSQRRAPDSGDIDPRLTQRESESDAQGQEQLRRDLGELMRRLGEALGDIPRALGRAEQSMRDARDALQDNRSPDAIGPQTRALDQLQQGMQAMTEEFLEQMGTAARGNAGQLNTGPGNRFDPLGRRAGNRGLEALEGVEIPSEMELRRAREILDELRRRRGERRRPPLELDYIDRLLRRF